mmetsp:Transcript_40233/g.126649  ORF Transcript_40233/g.126649 Transcript_40233/m.126649 type:complete len:248 (-) Transcript_40233:1627-2370(-)
MRGEHRHLVLPPRHLAVCWLDPQPLLRLSLQVLLCPGPRRHLLDRRQAKVRTSSSHPPAPCPRASLRRRHPASFLLLVCPSPPCARSASLPHRLSPPSQALAADSLLLLFLLRCRLLPAARPFPLILPAPSTAPGLAGLRVGGRRNAAGEEGGDASVRATAGAGERLRSLPLQGARVSRDKLPSRGGRRSGGGDERGFAGLLLLLLLLLSSTTHRQTAHDGHSPRLHPAGRALLHRRHPADWCHRPT